MRLFDDDDVVVTLVLSCSAADVREAVASCVPVIQRLNPVAGASWPRQGDDSWSFAFTFVTHPHDDERIDDTVRRALVPVLRYFDLTHARVDYHHRHMQTYLDVDLPRFTRYAVAVIRAEPGAAISLCVDGPADPTTGPRWTGLLDAGGDDGAVAARLHVGLAATTLAQALPEAVDMAQRAGAPQVLVEPDTGGYAAAFLLQRPTPAGRDALADAARPHIEQYGLHGARFALHDVEEWQVGACEHPWRLGPYALYVRRYGMDPLSPFTGMPDTDEPDADDAATDEALAGGTAEIDDFVATLRSLFGIHVYVCAEVAGLDGIDARELVRHLAQQIATRVGSSEPLDISEPHRVDGNRIAVTAAVGPVELNPQPALTAAVAALHEYDWHRLRYDPDGSVYADWCPPATPTEGLTALRLVAGQGTLALG